MSTDSRSPSAEALPTRFGPPTAVWWLIGLSLAVIATCEVFRLDEPWTPSAEAQVQAGAGARGVFAFPAQMTKATYGVFMVDVDTGTIWCYEFTGQRKLWLAAARSWRFDRYLENHNLADPTPAEIEQLVEQQRLNKLQSSGAGPAPGTP